MTGELGGYAWAENLGWISLSCTNTAACGTTDYGVKTGWCQSVATAPRVSVPAIPRFAWSTDRLEVRAPRR